MIAFPRKLRRARLRAVRCSPSRGPFTSWAALDTFILRVPARIAHESRLDISHKVGLAVAKRSGLELHERRAAADRPLIAQGRCGNLKECCRLPLACTVQSFRSPPEAFRFAPADLFLAAALDAFSAISFRRLADKASARARPPVRAIRALSSLIAAAIAALRSTIA